MTKQDAKKLPNGLYRLFWKSGGDSLAAVGTDQHGDRWIAPINWSTGGTTLHWKLVDHVEEILPFKKH